MPASPCATPSARSKIAVGSVILTAAGVRTYELLHGFERMVDELYGACDAMVPRGLERAIQEGLRIGARL